MNIGTHDRIKKLYKDLLNIKIIHGKNIKLRKVEGSDAKFITKIRNDSNLNKFINNKTIAINDQKKWIELNKSKNELYFIIKFKNKNLGTVRIYNINCERFSWGSWILIKEAPNFAALESALMVYKLMMIDHSFSYSEFDVRKKNNKVISFHLKFGAKIVAEDELNFYFKITNDQIIKNLTKYKRLVL